MLKTRLILVVACIITVWLIFQLPKSVVENEAELKGPEPDEEPNTIHVAVDPQLQNQINSLRLRLSEGIDNRNSAIFADSLASLYQKATRYDSAAWYTDQANTFFETTESILKTGEAYFKAFSFALDNTKRNEMAGKTRTYFQKVLDVNSHNLDVKTKIALTYIGTSTPMQGINMLREVLTEDPKFQPALFNMGMLSVQSGQYSRAIDWLTQLLEVDADDIQGNLLLGVAYAGNGETEKAREQFEKVKQLDSDPAVQQQADAYLKDLQ